MEEPAAPGEPWFDSELPDPVFEGMVKEFGNFDDALRSVSSQVEVFMEGVLHLADGLQSLSESLAADLGRTEDRHMTADSWRLRQAANQITHPDAPHSSVAKLKRNMDFNVVKPLDEHLANNEKLQAEFEKRRRRLDEFKYACKQMDECTRRGLCKFDQRLLMAQEEYRTSKSCFDKQDRHVFEWLYTLELHRNDILDSCMQTLKYLQYEFFATSAHALSGSLPARMAFRPMAEMLPECLEAQVDSEIREAENDLTDGLRTGDGFSVRLVERLARDEDEGQPQLPVDALSLSSLLSQGFEEGPARRALRLHGNDTQAAMDWLIEGGGSEAPRPVNGNDGVRLPTSAKHTRRRRELLEQQRERLRRAEAERVSPAPTGLGASFVFE